MRAAAAAGTLASAIALSRGCDGDFSVALRQPAGTVYASVTRQASAVTAASIGGSVALEAPITVAIWKKRILRGAFFCCTIGAKEV